VTESPAPPGPYRARPAVEADAAAIARIHNQGIAERGATFETEPRTAAGVATGVRERGPRFPLVVVERAGVVVAWAGVGAYRDRPCYAGVGEFSVYVDRAARGRGAGRAAVAALLEACEAAGYWKLVSRVFPENTASRALLRALGFREVGVYRRHARLDGAWRDCVIVERLLGPALLPPEAPPDGTPAKAPPGADGPA
jgi:L-amino acid N-acyltransferase YncA